MHLDYRVISIGTLAAHPLWNERQDVRTGHATTVLVESGDSRLVVNPGLPAAALAARFSEQTPVQPDEITHVFLTSLAPDHRRGLSLFESARWMAHGPERDAALAANTENRDIARDAGDDDLVDLYRDDRELLQRIEDAPDTIGAGVDLFPLPGATPGTCGLLLPFPGLTVLVAGDACATMEHVQQGKVLPTCLDLETAQQSFAEAIEIADVIVPGRGNVMLNPLRRGML